MKNILIKISAIKKEIGKLQKNADNPFFKSKYLDLNEILANLEPFLEIHKVVLLQPIKDNYVVTQLHDLESGEVLESSIRLPESMKPQDIGSAITYYRRYSLQSLLSLQAEDDDGNKASVKPYEFLEQSKTLKELTERYNALSKQDQLKYKDLATSIKNKLNK